MSEQSQGDTYLAWIGTKPTPCTGSSISDLDGKLRQVLVLQPAGGATNASTPFTAGLGTTFSNLSCGGAYYMQSVIGVAPYNVVGMVASNLDTNAGKLSLAWPESFTLVGSQEGSGAYKMSTTFKNNRPTYKNGDWWCWFDGTSWVISTPLMDVSGTHYKNNAGLPNSGPYGSLVVSGESCYNVSDFTGDVASANGRYCKAGFVGGRDSYTHESGEWFIYWGGTKWVLTNTPYNRNGEWIYNGSGALPGDFTGTPPEGASNGFAGQTGNVVSTAIPGGALYTEDANSVLSVEDLAAVITTEG